MKKFSTLISLLLVTVMILGVFSACADMPEATTQPEQSTTEAQGSITETSDSSETGNTVTSEITNSSVSDATQETEFSKSESDSGKLFHNQLW